MLRSNVLGLTLAATLALTASAGCKLQSPSMPSGTGTNVSDSGQSGAAPAQTQAAATETAAAMGEEREMDTYGAAADGAEGAAAYVLAMLGQPSPPPGGFAATATGGGKLGAKPVKAGAKARVKIQVKRAVAGKRLEAKAAIAAAVKAKLEARQGKMQQRLRARVAELKERGRIEEAFKKVAWVADEAAGTESKTVSFDVTKTVNGASVSRAVSMTRVRRIEDKVLLSATIEFKNEFGNGNSRTATRTKTLQEDGSYLVVFKSTQAFKDGTTRVVDWSKTISADGQVSGGGTITVKGPKGERVTNVSFSGTEEAPEASAQAEGAEDAATVTVPAEGEATATTTDGETVAVDAAAESTVATEPAPAASTEPSPAASTEPSPEASESPSAEPSTEPSTEASAS